MGLVGEENEEGESSGSEVVDPLQAPLAAAVIQGFRPVMANEAQVDLDDDDDALQDSQDQSRY